MRRKKRSADAYCCLLVGERGAVFCALDIPSQSSHRFGPLVIQKGTMYEMIKSENVVPLATPQNDLLHGWNKLPIENVTGNARALPVELM